MYFDRFEGLKSLRWRLFGGTSDEFIATSLEGGQKR
jgi:hypothetical protein